MIFDVHIFCMHFFKVLTRHVTNCGILDVQYAVFFIYNDNVFESQQIAVIVAYPRYKAVGLYSTLFIR